MPIKGHHGGRSQTSGSCHCMSEDCHTPHGHLDHTHWPAGATVPRTHSSPQPYTACHECLPSSTSSTSRKMQLAPPAQPGPFHSDGFRTLQYHRPACRGQRSESPNRIRHLVHSVQRLFNKSHSVEDPTTRVESNYGDSELQERRLGGHGGRHRAEEGHHPTQHNSHSGRRSRSHDRSKSRDMWSSDLHLNWEGSNQVTSEGRHGAFRGYHTLDREATPRNPVTPEVRGASQVRVGTAAREESRRSVNRGAWTSGSVTRGWDTCPHARTVKDSTSEPLGSKVKEHFFHYLQVPRETCPGDLPPDRVDGSEEVPCHRIRSGSYIKAMAERDSADPGLQKRGRATPGREAFRHTVSMEHQSRTTCSCQHCSPPFRSSHSLPRTRSPDTTCVCPPPSTQSQAVEALDLPGTFRARSHSYLCAIQAGVSQDDCLPPVSRVGTLSRTALLPDRKVPPPLPPRMSKSRLRVAAQSSTESAQSLRSPVERRARPHSQSLDDVEDSGRHLHRGGCPPWMDTGWVDGWFEDSGSQPGVLQGPGTKQRSYSTEMLDRVCEPLEPPFLAGLDSMRASLLGRSRLDPRELTRDSVTSSRDAHSCNCRPSVTMQRETLGTLSDSDTDSKATREMQSIGIQVEADRKYLWRDDNGEYLRDQEERRYHRPEGNGRYLREEDERYVRGEDDGRYLQDQEDRRYLCREDDRMYLRHQEDRRHLQSRDDERFLQDQNYRTYLCCKDGERRFVRDEDDGNCLQAKDSRRFVQGDNEMQYLQVEEDMRHMQRSSSLTTDLQTDPEDEGSLDRGKATQWNSSLQRTIQNFPLYRGQRDAEFYLHLLRLEVQRIEGWCRTMEREAEQNQLPEEVLARIHSAVEDAQLLMSQKVQHFFQLCQKSLDPTAIPHSSTRNLAALWELLQLALEEIRLEFLDLQRLQDSGWRLPPDQGDRNNPPPLPKKPSGSGAREGPVSVRGEWSVELGEGHGTPPSGERPTSLRQNSATESSDGTERYIHEGQTRF
ncbi:disks large-associated protein 3-like [Arapaima gigas]